MLSQIFSIIKDGIISLFYNIDGNKNSRIKMSFFFIIIPLLVAIYFMDMDMKDIIDDLISSLSIFTALIFGVLFIIPDKLSQRSKKLQENKNESTRNYLIRFLNFSRIFTKQVSFTIVLCIVLIVLLIIQKIKGGVVIVFINSLLFTILIMFLLTILSNIYILLMDDIDNNAKNIK